MYYKTFGCEIYVAWQIDVNDCSAAATGNDDVIKWNYFPRYCPFVRGIHWWFPSQRPARRSFDVFFDFMLQIKYLRTCIYLYRSYNSRQLQEPSNEDTSQHDDVIKWKYYPRYWPFVRGIHRSQVNSTHKGQWRRALMFSFICAWINCWVNNREAGDLRHNHPNYEGHCNELNIYVPASPRTGLITVVSCKNRRMRTPLNLLAHVHWGQQ